MLVTVSRFLFRQMSLDLDSPEVVNVVTAKVSCILGPVVVLIHVVTEGLDNGLAVNDNVGQRCRAAVSRVGRGQGPGGKVKGQELGSNGRHVPVRGHPGLDGPLLALGVDLEDGGSSLGDLRKVDVNGGSIRIDGEARFKVKGLPVLWEAIEKTSDWPRVVVLRRARDGQRGQGRDELVIQASGFAPVEGVSDVTKATAMKAVRINLPSVGPQPVRGGEGPINCRE
jgi:hypothetical protein